MPSRQLNLINISLILVKHLSEIGYRFASTNGTKFAPSPIWFLEAIVQQQEKNQVISNQTQSRQTKLEGVADEPQKAGNPKSAVQSASVQRKEYAFDWGAFALIEFLGSCQGQIGTKYKTALDIGAGMGVQTEIMRHAGLEVFQVDKYSESADFQVDFIDHEFEQKFDIIYCSHVIEHQRNVGAFLDKIFDILEDDGLLLISAPKHPAERLVEGHLNCFFTTYFIQHLIHAGFDCKNGKFLSCGGIENAAIVPKAENFCTTERKEDGYQWTAEHQERSFLPLKNQELKTAVWFLHNCQIITSTGPSSININFPAHRTEFGIDLALNRWGIHVSL